MDWISKSEGKLHGKGGCIVACWRLDKDIGVEVALHCTTAENYKVTANPVPFASTFCDFSYIFPHFGRLVKVSTVTRPLIKSPRCLNGPELC